MLYCAIFSALVYECLLCILLIKSEQVITTLLISSLKFSALVYECLLCISLIKPEKTLMQEASRHVGRFMRSADSNLRYVGNDYLGYSY